MTLTPVQDSVRSRGLTLFAPLHTFMATRHGWTAHLICVVLGAVMALAFAPLHLTPILAISLIGLVWMMDGARGHKRWGKAVFARGWFFGFGFFLTSMYWTAEPFLVDPARHALLLWMPLVLLPGGMALLWGTGAAMAASFWSSSPSRVFVFSFFMALAEWMRGHLFGGFPWNLLGTSWAPGGAVSQAASVGGVYWLTLLTLFVCTAFAALVDTRDERGLVGRALPLVMAVALLAGGWAWGAKRIEAPTPYSETTLLLMDAGLPQAEKTSVNAGRVLRRYLDLLRSVPSEPGDVVVWPENPIPVAIWPGSRQPTGLIQTPDAVDAVVGSLAGRVLITGTARSEDRGAQGYAWYNSMVLLDDSSARYAAPLALYDKHRLVPFGELAPVSIIPFGEAFAGILPGALNEMARAGFEPGVGATVIVRDGIVPDFIPMICYEALFPAVPRRAQTRTSLRAQWMVVASNDAWFGKGLGPHQHYAQNRYRSIEMGLPMARVATLGATAIVDGLGRETAVGAPAPGDPGGWRSAVVRAPLPQALEQTLYVRFGAAFFWMTLAGFAILSFVSWRR